MRRSTYLASLALLLAGTAVAGPPGFPPRPAPACCVEPPPAGPSPGTPATTAADADTRALDDLVGTLYATVSGDPGTGRDWPALERLLAPGARLHLTRAAGAGLAVDSLDLPAFIALHESRVADRGFHEREVARHVAGFGGVRHVWSAFEARRSPDDVTPYARGVNSLQLVRTADGWRIVSITWDFETPERPLPARLDALALGAAP